MRTSVRRFATLPVLVTIALAICVAMFGQERQRPLTNADVMRMLKGGVPESTILSSIQSSPAKFDLSPDALVALHKAEVSQKIMDAMMARGSGGHTNDQRMRLQKAQLKLKLGPKLRLSSSLRTSVDPAVTQALLEQSRQAHSEKASAGHLGATRTPASNPSRGAVPAAGHVSLAENSRASNQIGPSRTLSQSGTAPSGASSMPRESAQRLLKVPPQQSRAQMIALGQQPLSICQSVTNTQPGIETVSGRIKGVIFTPDPGKGPSPNNQYTIKGCHFGAVEGNVHIFGAFLNNPSPVKLGIDSWNDALIVVTFDPTFQNEYDLNNITLVVVTQSGASAQLPGNSFLATRVSQPLTRIPHSLVKLPSTHLQTDDFISPATPANLQNLGLTSPSASAVFYQYGPLWSTNVGDGYPLTRITWNETIDFSKLRSGFALDVDIQTVMGSPGPLLENGGLNVSEGSCKYSDITLGAQMNGSVLGLGVQPAECDNSGKFIFASYGLALSVTGPKGEKLSPWPENL